MITNNENFQWKNKSRNKLVTGEAYVRLNIKTKHKKSNLSFKNSIICQKMSQKNKVKDKSINKPNDKNIDMDKAKDVAITNPKTGIQRTIPLLRKSLPIDRLKNSNKTMIASVHSNGNSNANLNLSSRVYLNSKQQLMANDGKTYKSIQNQLNKLNKNEHDESSFIQTERLSKPYTIEDYQSKCPVLMNKKMPKRCSTINEKKQQYKEILSYSQTDRRNNSKQHHYDTNVIQSSIKWKKTKHIISLSIDTAMNKEKFNVSDGNMNISLIDVIQNKSKKAYRPLSRTMIINKPIKASVNPNGLRNNYDSHFNNDSMNMIRDKKGKRESTSLLLKTSSPYKKLNTSLNNKSLIRKEITANSNFNKPMIHVCKKKKSKSVFDNPKIAKDNLPCPNNEIIIDNTSCLDQPLPSLISKSTNITSNDNLIADNKNNNVSNVNANNNQQLIKKKIVKVGSISKAGFSGAGISKINQDSYGINQENEGLDCFFICDGHGALGHRVSDFVIETLPKICIREIIDKTIFPLIPDRTLLVNKAIENSIILTNSKLSNIIEIDTNFSGTTCNAIVIHNNIVYCANVGDSRAILGKLSRKGKWSYEPLSRDHKATEIDEANRIKRFGGRIEPFKDDKGLFIGPMRIWLRTKQIPGLAMTRSIGDQIASTVGVTCDPEIKNLQLKEEDKFILMASDGVWEYLTNNDCVEILSKFYKKKDVEGAVNKLYKEAHKLWKEVSINPIISKITYFRMKI